MTDRSGARKAGDEQARNVEVVKRYLRTFVTKDLTELADVVDEDVEVYGSGTAVRGRRYPEAAVSAPGLTVLDQEIREIFAAGDRVVVSLAQTYRRDATGATAVQSACKMYRLAGGRIVQFWGEQDTYGLLRGLGLLPDEPITF
ncbi:MULTISPECIES: nuclear transport factor 2 family protein [unclassified Micromonospora]|uniref:nuclear transport factor 2 family protein n=1 Tax=unclassified Micromonospora TaxID=2617518 RepID=UPI001C239C2D|nr:MULTISPECIES: nuclear transport factor 2 family protein [unclassified Micromonospora]MBU8859269.1 nuclear transport factor 2 family protein [Micromonospora sp. WMMB482]MDM4778781.1 nuclear transport factor 2 family protein [Micromonospora sp. b486]